MAKVVAQSRMKDMIQTAKNALIDDYNLTKPKMCQQCRSMIEFDEEDLQEVRAQFHAGIDIFIVSLDVVCPSCKSWIGFREDYKRKRIIERMNNNGRELSFFRRWFRL